MRLRRRVSSIFKFHYQIGCRPRRTDDGANVSFTLVDRQHSGNSADSNGSGPVVGVRRLSSRESSGATVSDPGTVVAPDFAKRAVTRRIVHPDQYNSRSACVRAGFPPVASPFPLLEQRQMSTVSSKFRTLAMLLVAATTLIVGCGKKDDTISQAEKKDVAKGFAARVSNRPRRSPRKGSSTACRS